jgi:photosystem II stability/assembly factor-like uncharacterized protein
MKKKIIIITIFILLLSLLKTSGQEYENPVKVIDKVLNLIEKNDLNKAEELLTQYIPVYQNNPHLHYYLGLIYKIKNKPEKGIKEINKSLDIKPDMAEAYYYLAILYEQIDLKNKAIEMLKKGYKISYQKGNSSLKIKIIQELEKLGVFPGKEKNWIEHGWLDIEGARLNKIFFTDKQNGIAVGTSDYSNEIIILKTEDSGKNWKKIDINLKGSIETLYFIDKNLGWAGGYEGNNITRKLLLKTSDGGKNWEQVYLDQTKGYISSIFFLNINEGWMTGGNKIYHTVDGGLTWKSYSDFKSIIMNFNDIMFINSDTGWVAGFEDMFNKKKGIIYKTVDSGKTWIKMKVIDSITDIKSVYFLDNNTGWLAGCDGFSPCGSILITTNGGKDWVLQKNIINSKLTGYDFPGIMKEIYFINSKYGWACGSDNNGLGILLKTADGGLTWYRDDTDNLNISSLNSIFFLNKDMGWSAGERLMKGPVIITFKR